MARLTLVENDPFASGPKLTPVDYDPFAEPAKQTSAADFTASMLRKFKQGAALGFGDEASGALKATFGGRGAEGNSWSERYKNARDYERSAYNNASAKTGVFGSAAELLGSAIPSMAAGEIVGAANLAKAAPSAAKLLLPASGEASAALPALQGAATAAPKAISSPLSNVIKTGALTGSVQAVGDTENNSEIPSAAVNGALLGSAGGLLGYGAGKSLERLARITNTAPRVAQAPSTDNIKDAAQAAYDRFKNAGGLFTQEGLNDLAGSVRNRLTEMGWQPELAPKVTAFNRALERARTGSGAPTGTAGLNQTATPEQILNLRKIAGKISDSNDATESAYGQALKQEIDNFLSTPKEGNFAGAPGVDQSQLANDLSQANRLWTQFSKADAVDEAFGKAGRRAGSTYSGGNENNAIRQELRRYYEQRGPKNFTPDERAAFETAIRGGRTENIARMLGKLAPSRGGLSTWANIGAGASTGGATLPITALAEGAKVIGDRATRRNLEEVSRVIRAGGQRNNVNVTPNQLEMLMRQLSPSLAAPGGAAIARGLL